MKNLKITIGNTDLLFSFAGQRLAASYPWLADVGNIRRAAFVNLPNFGSGELPSCSVVLDNSGRQASRLFACVPVRAPAEIIENGEVLLRGLVSRVGYHDAKITLEIEQ